MGTKFCLHRLPGAILNLLQVCRFMFQTKRSFFSAEAHDQRCQSEREVNELLSQRMSAWTFDSQAFAGTLFLNYTWGGFIEKSGAGMAFLISNILPVLTLYSHYLAKKWQWIQCIQISFCSHSRSHATFSKESLRTNLNLEIIMQNVG